MRYEPPKTIWSVAESLKFNEPLEDANDPRLVCTDAARGDFSFDSLLKPFGVNLRTEPWRLEFKPRRVQSIFCGHRGCGKSTELHRLAHKLDQSRLFCVCFLDARRYLDINNLQYPDLLMALAHRNDRAWGSFTQFDCTRITEPFFISKYPVTVAQFQLFVEAGGYERAEFWTVAGREWREGRSDTRDWENWLRDEYRKEQFPITRPKDYGPEFQTPNHPRVGVSWYEAHAYGAWLNSQEVRPHLARDQGLPEDNGLEIRLPTEAEWELAARWNREKGEADDRLYPWGDASTEADLTERCNWDGAKIGHTSAVGLFPKGNAECGAADLAGNVWEWCQTEWINRDDKDALKRYNSGVYDRDDGGRARVLRGASWGYDDPDVLVSSFRYYFVPGYRAATLLVFGWCWWVCPFGSVASVYPLFFDSFTLFSFRAKRAEIFYDPALYSP